MPSINSPTEDFPASAVYEKKIFENFLERAMLRPLADVFRPNENGFR
jgi:hypothetical protein